ncbi:MAG: T9SS type A sorting domain-containing protein [Flavobacteriales bacterium]|nr:T9SS type A sorting domain-containing protein [Flavobacteriales bacterium]
MKLRIVLSLICMISSVSFCSAQTVDIDNYSVNTIGQAQLSIQGEADKYYILHAQHGPDYNWAVSMTIGVDGTMIIAAPGAAYPLENYTITEHDIADPDDWDGDGIDDITEFSNMPTDAPINNAYAVDFEDGTTSIPDAQTFMDLATINNVGWAPFLDGQLYVKFGILDRDTDEPKVYFINSNTHVIHAGFWGAIGATVDGDDGSGEIVFNANDILPNGVIGSYSFNFSFGNAYNFEDAQRTYELLIANMPFLQNNMNHFIGQGSENNYLNNYADQYEDANFDVVLESDVFADINYIPFHEAEGYGFFRHMSLDETPGSRDIVLYDQLPNSLPRVGGIITSVVQTPLSHVNLRAIQDNVPNAYITDPLSIDSIANLLGSYVYYKAENETFQFREATLDEVNAWYEDLRPTEPQIPVRDLSITEIIPLDDIEFDMSSAFGAKCSNVATMRTFGFSEGTIPDGFGIPFYFYDEFMQFNNFYEEAQVMIDNPSFQNDINFRIERLDEFRDDIKAAPMPDWMLDELQAMHDAFPEGTAVRCRSSTNNEDLPGFSGAGLYTSKTQHLDEGHIQKSIKQVYASMWNFRAYEERDFYRVDHFQAAMGVLCHPNFQEEQSNGVGISIDPIYDTDSTYYLNTQVGESLITNPDPNSVPEEILLYQDPEEAGGYLVLALSNLVNQGELVMDQEYLDQMRDYLTVIHDEFAILYGVEGVDGFGMDIEYKVTAQEQLAIKQARPWVSFWADIKGNNDLGAEAVVEPQSSSSLGSEELVTATIANQGLNMMYDFDIELVVDGESMETIFITDSIHPFNEANFQFTVPIDLSFVGDYDIQTIVSDPDDEYGNNDTLNVVLSNLYALNGALAITETEAVCDDILEVKALVTNVGESMITEVQIEVIANGLVVDLVDFNVEIPYQESEELTVSIDDNLEEMDNDIELNIITVNDENDLDLANNSASVTTNLESNYDIITFIINADDYPQETSWKIEDETTGQIVSTGALNNGDEYYSEDICVNYGSCFSVYFYDSYGDGICCAYGEGDFQVLNAEGEVIVFNNGEFDFEVVEVFCPNETGCTITADLSISNTSSTSANDGSITIYTSSGVSPFEYSIDGGQTFSTENSFTDLPPGEYTVVVVGATGLCSYEEVVSIQACEFTTADVITVNASSAVTTDGSIEINPTSGVAPYQYSIDGGQTFFDTNLFTDLPIGPYNVVVEDATGVCAFELDVPILIEDEVNVEETQGDFSEEIKIYPNPTDNLFNVEISSYATQTIKIEVYDHLGRIIETSSIVSGASTRATLSLEGQGSGTYLVRCYTQTDQKCFKVIKM